MQVAIVNRAESENLRSVYVQILRKGFEVCANGFIVVKITVAVGGKSGNKTAKINVNNLFDLLLSVRVMTDDLH